MPAATPKRVKNVRISRPFIIGNEAWELDETTRKPDTPPDHTKGWKVYVKGTDNGPNITAWLKKVQFKIYHTYSNPVRVVEEPPFEIQETGWGGFMVDIKLFFTPEASAKPETRTHFLQLEYYGSDAERAAQQAARRVRSDFLEIVEFNEPPEALYTALTGDDQWLRRAAKGKGKGKGKGKAAGPKGKARGADDGSVELPETGDAENAFTKEHERALVASIERKMQALQGVKADEEARARRAIERLELLRAKQQEADAAAKGAGTAGGGGEGNGAAAS